MLVATHPGEAVVADPPTLRAPRPRFVTSTSVAALSPDGRTLAYQRGASLVVEPTFDGASAPLVTLSAPDPLAAIAFDTDHEHLWIAGRDATLRRAPLVDGAVALPVATMGYETVLALHTAADGEVIVRTTYGLRRVCADGSPPRTSRQRARPRLRPGSPAATSSALDDPRPRTLRVLPHL